MMYKRIVFYKLVGISLAAAVILASCNFAATPIAPASATGTRMASPIPVVPTATITPAPSVTDTATPVSTATPAVADTSTSTAQLAAQVNPGMNAYCRKGPGTGYYSITYLQVGTFYNVIGRNGLGTWWLVQVPPNLNCWMGDPTAVTQGPVDQTPVLLVQPLPGSPSGFANTYTCSATLHTLEVSLTWSVESNVTGYRIYRNGSLVGDVGPHTAAFNDSAAPLKLKLVYQLEAYNDYGVGNRVKTTVPSCD
jgi:hypothetical protein